MKSLRDLWIEMSIREISTQCKFSLIAWQSLNVTNVESIDSVFYSAHSFLMHVANTSKLLKAASIDLPSEKGVIALELEVKDTSIIHDRTLRNSLEHYDERLTKWINEKGVTANIGTYNIGPRQAVSGSFVFVTHYDPSKRIFTFVDEDFDLSSIALEVQRIKKLADEWIVNSLV